MPRINSSDWQPIGVNSLEPTANDVIREIEHNAIVTAGPGAGKTELLAQKASYLLQTGLCPSPKRILAISFKKDAAKNLKERVELRCGKELATRFDSMTFDAFSKSILDRFRNGLPEIWRPSDNYEIDFTINNANPMLELLRQINLSESELQQLHYKSFERHHLTGNVLPETGLTEETLQKQASKKLWHYLLHEQQPSRLSFTMIGRLAELIMRTNPKLLQALRNSYAYVFLDEFQDTTDIQFDLTKTCFQNCTTLLTAVGDNKQRIMGWAGALDDVFNHFQTNFQARSFTLIRNYRSAPRLVAIQHTITQVLEGTNAVRVESMDTSGDEGECRILIYDNSVIETQHIATIISDLLLNDDLAPRDICLLTRQTPDRYTTNIMHELSQRGISARIESELQDLLSESFILLVLDMLKLISRTKSPHEWTSIIEFLVSIYGEDQANSLANTTNQFIKTMKLRYATNGFNNENDVVNFLTEIKHFFGNDVLTTEFRQYRQGNYLNDILQKASNSIYYYYQNTGHNLKNALDAFEGKNSIPIMTMHKSKGLEFHTVIFIGLEDSALWGYANNATEETNGFFVAFSRAKKRIIFTASINREINGVYVRQNSQSIAPLYGILDQAGIVRENMN
ncbi:MAG TPA: ATP-dependent helicase [Sulfuricurvum sp.]|jgi:superfamily I DNA/RNA helicase|nr:MAG: hypothetical protein B7Y30_09495 [Campylobacterales bacterium 16-40-21]OZA02108.1 MAG: hypothetical protein B7X89_10755 [Sulfuricurvum sp. 17-40-25]HQS67759.1 ATP-dependent helicase [Sulfuricurvum sp.]HQT37190.1 ATP-dependent helicase [Sulfuricurvum sp.]